MSAKSIQKKLDLAHKKIGKRLGSTYNIYRTLSNIDPIDDANYIDDVQTTFTLSDTYTSAMGWGVPVWTCYTDAKQIQQGDFLYTEYDETGNERTFYIMSRQPLLPVMAVEVNQRIDIMEVAYADPGTGYAPSAETYFAKNLPAFVSFGATSISGLVPARNVAVAGVRTVDVITHFPDQDNLMHKSLTLSSEAFSGSIVNYNFSPIGLGVKFQARESGA